MPNAFAPRCSLAIALSLGLLAVPGCQPAPVTPQAVENDESASLPLYEPAATAGLSEADAKLVALLEQTRTLPFEQPALTETAGYSVLATASPSPSPAPSASAPTSSLQTEEALRANYYAGPYPAAALGIPAGFQLVGTQTTSPNGGTQTFKTYRAANGLGAPALHRTFVKGGKTLIDVVSSPSTVIPALPALFQARLNLSVPYTVEQGQDSYTAYNVGSLSGAAIGYRWAVLDASRKLLAWITAVRVTTKDGIVDRYDVYSDYKSAAKASRYAYGALNNALKLGQRQDFQTTNGLTVSTGAVDNLVTKFTTAVNEDVVNGRVHRVSTTTYGATSQLSIEEFYNADNSGDGTATLQGAKAALKWNAAGYGTLTFAGAASRPYMASRNLTSTGGQLLQVSGTAQSSAKTLKLDGDGTVYSLTGQLNSTVYALGSSGNKKYDLSSYGISAFDFDPKGYVWKLRKSGKTLSLTKSKNLQTNVDEVSPIFLTEGDMLAVGSDSNVWVAASHSKDTAITRYDALGQKQATAFSLPVGSIEGLRAGNGVLWVSTIKSNVTTLTAYDTTGKVLATIDAGKNVNDFALAPSGQVWLATDDVVKRYSATGTLEIELSLTTSTTPGLLSEVLALINAVLPTKVTTPTADPVKPKLLAVDSLGNLWVQDKQNVLRLFAR